MHTEFNGRLVKLGPQDPPGDPRIFKGKPGDFFDQAAETLDIGVESLLLTDIEPSDPVTAVERYWTARAMIEHGNSFMQGLAIALLRADDADTEKIKETWWEDWQRFERIGNEMRKENEESTVSSPCHSDARNGA